jgi:predicted RNase H-like HicB family nuclease
MPPIYYPAVIDRSASGYGVSFPDFPGCVAAGATVQEAAVNAEAALALHLDGMRADKEKVPQPSSLDDIEPVEGADDVARVLVRVEVPAGFTRIQVTIEDGVLAAIDAVSSNRSGFLVDAARVALQERAGLAKHLLLVAWQKKNGWLFREKAPEAIFAHRSVYGIRAMPGDFAIVSMKDPVTPAMMADMEAHLRGREFQASVGPLRPDDYHWVQQGR